MPGQNLDAEILIIGGGPAGLTSAIYATRARRKTVLIDKVMPGGQVMNTALIENYPGFPGGINGAKLASRFVEQAKSFGPDIRMDEAVEIDIEQDAFIVKTYSGQITAAAVIIASGALPQYSSPRPAPRRKILQGRAFANEKIGFIWDSVVTKIIGDKKVEAVELLNKKTGEVRTSPTEGVFVFIGNIRQVVSGAGEGATAAYYANKYLES